jgi:hypothetical protein
MAAVAAIAGQADGARRENTTGTINAVDKALVDAAMKRAEEGATDEELDRLRAPELPYQVTDYALSFPSAWRNKSAGFERNGDAISDVQTFAMVGGWRYYSEWACGSGQERSVAEKVVEVLPRVVNTYLFRLLMRQFILERNFEGYHRTRKCDAHKLQAERSRFDQLYAAVSKLAR